MATSPASCSPCSDVGRFIGTGVTSPWGNRDLIPQFQLKTNCTLPLQNKGLFR